MVIYNMNYIMLYSNIYICVAFVESNGCTLPRIATGIPSPGLPYGFAQEGEKIKEKKKCNKKWSSI